MAAGSRIPFVAGPFEAETFDRLCGRTGPAVSTSAGDTPAEVDPDLPDPDLPDPDLPDPDLPDPDLPDPDLPDPDLPDPDLPDPDLPDPDLPDPDLPDPDLPELDLAALDLPDFGRRGTPSMPRGGVVGRRRVPDAAGGDVATWRRAPLQIAAALLFARALPRRGPAHGYPASDRRGHRSAPPRRAARDLAAVALR